MKFLICDIRRLFSKKALVALFVLAPVVVMMLFAAIIAPMLVTGKGLHFNLAILQEDEGLEVRAFIFQMVHSESIAGMVTLFPVDSVDDGLALLKKNQVSVLLHIPPGVVESLSSQGTVRISIYGTPGHALETSLIAMTLGHSLMTVGQGQNQMIAAKELLVEKGVPVGEADIFRRDLTIAALAQYMNRRRILGDAGAISPLGEYLPVEYYLAAIFALFAAFAMLPLIHFTASDLSGSILRRGLACGRGIFQFYFSRLASGMLFILLVLLMVFPMTFLLKMSDQLIGSRYQGSLPALLITIGLASICFSALAAALAAWIGKVQPALWTGFYLAMGMAVAGGALVPDQSLPAWLPAIGRLLPLRAAMRGLSSALFTFDPTIFGPDMLKLAIMAAILVPVGLLGFVRRGRGA